MPFTNQFSTKKNLDSVRRTIGPQERKFSTAPIIDRQLSRQKIRQKISVIKTNFFDNIKKTVYFGILIHVLS